jgi:putative ABC transport system permease protein
MPMIRGRLVGINGTPSDRLRFRREDGAEFAGREQNLTWADQLGPDNRIVEGQWWPAATKGQHLVSIATEFQESMGLRLGDTLTFDIAGETIEARIANFRKVKWDSFQPNFFIVFAPGVIDDTAGTYMTSVHFPSGQAKSLASLARKYPSVSIFDIQDLLDRVRSVIDKAVLAVQSVFLFTLFAGLTVMMAAVQASRDERRYESAMLRTLGASRTIVLQGVLAEFVTLGALSGLLASVGAVLAGYFVATRVLEMKYTFEPLVWIVGMLGGAVLVAFSGWLATRSVINTPPVATLRAG